MINLFNSPKKYLSEFYSKKIFKPSIIQSMINDFKGLSMMCVWITKLCPLQCEKCFFRSNMNHDGMNEEEYKFSSIGIDRLIRFVNDSNSGYLMLSGGGDPMVFPDHVTRIISETVTKRIVIVTSGFWGKTEESAYGTINKLYKAFRERDNECEVVIRLSVDTYHENELGGNECYQNIINVFKNSFYNVSKFSLLIHTMREDSSMFSLADTIGGKISFGELGESDNKDVIKIVPQKAVMQIDDYTIPIGISKLFLSDLMVDINPPLSPKVIDAIRVMTDDMENSEQGNPSYIQNSMGRKGLDFWVDYNGNVTTWFNQDWYSLFNLYSDQYCDVVYNTFSNPMTAFFLKKGYDNRNKIIMEVNAQALLRAQSVNLRDYFAAFLLEEDNTKLYYAIRAVQTFLNDCYITMDDVNVYSPELVEAIKMPTNDLIKMYNQADYDILCQYMDEKYFDKEKWEDFFLLIALGQYKVSKKRLKEKIEIYNRKTHMNVCDVKEFYKEYNQDLYFRLHKRISFMKPETYHELYSKEEDV